MLKLIIFDLDGTLLNTSRDIHKVLNESLAHFYLPQVTLEQTIAMVGNGAKKLVQAAVPPGHSAIADSVYEFYSTIFVENENSLTTLYPDEDEVLRSLGAQGVKFAMVTNKPHAATLKVYDKLLKPYNFDMVIGGGAGFALKPDPSAALYILEKLNVKKQDALFVGDGETDVITAQAAGVQCVSALWGYRTRGQLAAAGATLFADNYKNFLQIAQKNL